MLHDQPVRTSWAQPCRVADRFAAVDPSGVSRQDHDVVERLTAIADVTGAVAGTTLDSAWSPHAAADLPSLLVVTAAAASRRLGARVVAWFPPGTSGSEAPSALPTGAGADPAPPDVCVPVVAAEPRPVAHLHVSYGRGVVPAAADRVTLELLAGHAVDLAAARAREADQAELVEQLRLQLGESRDDVAQLTRALESNRQIGLAMGVIVALEKLTPEQAFDRLRAASQNSNRKLAEIADDVVLTGEVPPRYGTRGSRTTPARRRSRGPAREDPDDGERDRVRRYQVDLTLRRERADLRLAGELDLAAHADLTGVFDRLESLPSPVHCDTSGVTFADSHGLGPVVAAARRRDAEGRPPVLLTDLSPAARRALENLQAGDLIDPRGVPVHPRTASPHFPPPTEDALPGLTATAPTVPTHAGTGGRPTHSRPPATATGRGPGSLHDTLAAARDRVDAADAAFEAASDSKASMRELQVLDADLAAATAAHRAGRAACGSDGKATP